MYKQSICYPLFKHAATSPEAFCELAAAIGYLGIDLWGREDMGALTGPAADHGLTITGFVAHGMNEPGFNQPDAHGSLQQTVGDAIKLAAKHHVPTVIAFTGNRIKGQTDIDALMHCADGLRPVARCARDHGVTVCVELLNSNVDHPHYLADRSDLGLALCQLVDSPAVKLLYDVYHMQLMEGNLLTNLRRSLPHVGHVHTAGVPGRHDLDDTQEINYRAVARALADADYQGFIGHEFSPRGDAPEAMRHAYRVIADGVADAAG